MYVYQVSYHLLVSATSITYVYLLPLHPPPPKKKILVSGILISYSSVTTQFLYSLIATLSTTPNSYYKQTITPYYKAATPY